MSMNCKGIPLLDRITVLFGGNYRGEWGDYRGEWGDYRGEDYRREGGDYRGEEGSMWNVREIFSRSK